MTVVLISKSSRVSAGLDGEATSATDFAAQTWRLDAACQGVSADLFYPEKGGSTREAKAVCQACPVRIQCLDFALANGERFGIWGGTSEPERRLLRRNLGLPPLSEAV